MSIQAQKGNKILRISEDAVQRYLNMGYNIVGADGAVLQKAVPSDNNQLKLEYSKQLQEIESLKATIETLEVKNKALTQENKALAKKLEGLKTTKPAEEVSEEVVEEKPATTRRRKKSAETTTEETSE